MDAMFMVFPVFFGIVFCLIIGGMIVHIILFGTIFGVVIKRISQANHEQARLYAKPCGYCAVVIPAGMEQCPGCGAKR